MSPGDYRHTPLHCFLSGFWKLYSGLPEWHETFPCIAVGYSNDFSQESLFRANVRFLIYLWILSFFEFLCIQEFSPWSNVQFANIASHTLAYLFTLRAVSLAEQELFSSVVFCLFIFLFPPLLWCRLISMFRERKTGSLSFRKIIKVWLKWTHTQKRRNQSNKTKNETFYK